MMLFVLIKLNYLLMIYMNEIFTDIELRCNDLKPILEDLRNIYNIKIVAAAINESGVVTILQLLPRGEYVKLW